MNYALCIMHYIPRPPIIFLLFFRYHHDYYNRRNRGMRKRIVLLVMLTLLMMPAGGCSASLVGTWNAYMAYHSITQVEKAGHVYYVLASSNLYAYNSNDESVQTYDKMNFLSDCDIQWITWNPTSKRLVIVYANQNIDLLDSNNNVWNVSDYYNKSMTEDKGIYHVYIYNQFAYICTGFGILKLNTAAAEISESYHLGFKVNYCYIEGGRIYAQSESKGLYTATLTDNLLDKSNWHREGSYTKKTFPLDEKLLEAVSNANPGGPMHNHFGFMKFHQGKLYTCRGWDNGSVKAPADEVAVQVMENNHWDIYQHEGIKEQTNRRYDNMAVLDVDPNDPNHVFVGSRNGLYEFENGQFVKYYDSENSPIQIFNMRSENPSKEYQITIGVKYDNDGNLWLLNSYSDSNPIIKYTKTREWQTYNFSELMEYTENNYPVKRSLPMLSKLFIDSRNYIWFVNNSWYIPSLFVYDKVNNSLISYKNFVNEDGTTLVLNNVRCVAEDHDKNIWVGTNMGPLMLEPAEMTAESPVFNQVKVPRNDGTNYADYLLNGVDIASIAVDGGGRKWFGTYGNGVYLISADNMTQLEHFTAENSKLLSNNVESIAINGTTGEVFFGTDKGLCSYMSDATDTNESMSKNSVYAYPNPVRPDYTGIITVVGLSYDADVKIVTSNGVLVAQGRSNGGSFTWDGCDMKGRRVASGIYMVQTATSSGGKGTVCKIAVIN